MDKRITVFTPTYNRAHTLHRVFDSLQQQNYRNFEWLVIDDGSSDNTDEIIQSFIERADFPIKYLKQENKHKFLTFLKAVDLVTTPYFVILDSDDSMVPNALKKLINLWEEAPKQTVFVSVLCQDSLGNRVGDAFPKSRMSSSIFDLRYKYKVKGDKWGMTKTDFYRKIKVNKDLFENKGFIPEGVFHYHLDSLGTHYCINEKLRIYHMDSEDELSLANSYYADKNAFGLCEKYKVFINMYGNQKFKHMKVMLRNLLGYSIFAAKDNRPYSLVLKEVNDPLFKFLVSIIYLAKPLLKKWNTTSLK